jgi:DNA-binding HxlR family transcriptional regulator
MSSFHLQYASTNLYLASDVDSVKRSGKRFHERGGFVKMAKRSVCPVACALDLIGDKWTLLLVRDLACGKALFKEFSASPERIATNILSNRLDRLVRSGLAESFSPSSATGRHGYRLTAKGKTLLPVLGALRDWGLTHIKGTQARMKPVG